MTPPLLACWLPRLHIPTNCCSGVPLVAPHLISTMEGTRAPWAKLPATAPPAVINSTGQSSSSASPASSEQSVLPAPSTSSARAFRTPTKQITSPMHLPAWKQSEAYADIVSFILHLNAAVRSLPSTAPHSRSPAINAICALMTQAKTWVADIPPIQQAMRFGNKAFRTWHARLMAALPAFLSSLLGPELVAAGAVSELSAYLDESFGNQQRIDYGTGHELNFVLFLLCVRRLGVVAADDAVALVCDVFASYLDLMELIQHTYWLEPAGSKGSWGLDDYQFLCFLWGSSQLVGKEDEYPPSTVLKPQSLEKLTADYLYFQAIVFIGRMKTGPFAEHSSLLHSIAQLQSWNKANGGLQRMYEEEVRHTSPHPHPACSLPPLFNHPTHPVLV